MQLNINENGAKSRTCAGRDAAPLNLTFGRPIQIEITRGQLRYILLR